MDRFPELGPGKELGDIHQPGLLENKGQDVSVCQIGSDSTRLGGGTTAFHKAAS